MRRLLFVLLISGLIIIQGCNTSNGTPSINPGSWTLGTATTGAFSAFRLPSTNVLVASNDFPPSPDSLFFYFNTYPTSGGSLPIVNSTSPGPGQVGIVLSQGAPPGPPQLYVPAPSSSSFSASVSVSGGKVSVIVPLIHFMPLGSPSDTSDFIAKVSQNQ